jgi:hypothetical protein
MANHLELALRDLDAKISELQETKKLLQRALSGSAGTGRHTRTMSAEGRERIAKAQKARWAKVRKEEKAKAATAAKTTSK